MHFFDIWRSKKAQSLQFLTLLTSKYALRHNGGHFFDIWTSKSGPNLSVFFTLLTWKCASHHKGVHFFDISTSKRGPRLLCFVYFDFEICFAPQRRTLTLFRHHNLQKCSEPVSFLHFWLGNVLRATTACNFSTSQLPKMVWALCVWYILTWKWASRHNGVQLFISHLASWLRTRCFSEATFRPARATNHWKNAMNRDFPTFCAPASSFFSLSLSLSSLIFSLLFFSSLTLHTSAFPSVHTVGSWLLNLLRPWLVMGRLVSYRGCLFGCQQIGKFIGP